MIDEGTDDVIDDSEAAATGPSAQEDGVRDDERGATGQVRESGAPGPEAPGTGVDESGRQAPERPRPDGLPGRLEPAPAGGRLPLEMARRIVELAEDKKAADIVLLELGSLTTLADYFVICSGGSERQLDAIADAIVEGLAAEGTEPIGREGTAASHWILLDYGAVVVHVLAPPERDYYQLERHWSRARTILRVQ